MTESTPDRLAAVLDQVSDALTRHGIWHALAFGTLLGAVRDGDIIPWDYDVDLFVRPADLRRILALNPDTERDGLTFRRTAMSATVLAPNPRGIVVPSGPRVSIVWNGTGWGDMYAFSLFSDGVLRWYDVEHEAYWCPESSFPHYFVEDLESVTIRGRPYPAPRCAAKWLEGTYGPGWRTPARRGAVPIDGHNALGYRYAPRLADEIAWCERQGWDRTAYRSELAWPRAIGAAGPPNADRERLYAWSSLADLSLHY